MSEKINQKNVATRAKSKAQFFTFCESDIDHSEKLFLIIERKDHAPQQFDFIKSRLSDKKHGVLHAKSECKHAGCSTKIIAKFNLKKSLGYWVCHRLPNMNCVKHKQGGSTIRNSYRLFSGSRLINVENQP